MKAIQFIGTQRSGSNLLRVMLNQHPRISSPHPPHILQVMMPFLPMYGDLAIESNFEMLIDDVCTLVERNPVNWDVQFDRDEVARRCSNRSLPQIMKAVYEIKATMKGADIWCCKSMASVFYMNEIVNADIHPSWLWLYRDGRDVACSFRKAVVGEKHIYFLAQQWKKEQELSLAQTRKEPNASIVLRYEEFTPEPEVALRMICDKLQIEYDPEMLNYAESKESKITAASGEMWSNLVRPVMKNNTRKFESELSYDDILVFESVAGDLLKELNYDCITDSSEWRTFTPEEIKEFAVVNDKLKKEARDKAPEDMTKRAAQDAFIQSLKKRFADYEKQTV
ncbi:MAG: hypothetical protein RL007_2797 [Bacteroidota bacterium]|jgi:hypothetical protein